MFLLQISVCMFKNNCVRKNIEAALMYFSLQKKAVVIRHLYTEDSVKIPEDMLSTVTDVNEAFDVCGLKPSEITIPEVEVPEIKSDQQVIILDFFNRYPYFLL